MVGHPSNVSHKLQLQAHVSTPSEQAAHLWTDWPRHPPAHQVQMRSGTSATPCDAGQYFAEDIAHPFSRSNSLGLTWGGVMANLAASRRSLSPTGPPCSPPALRTCSSTDRRVEGKLARLKEEEDDDESLPCSSMDDCEEEEKKKVQHMEESMSLSMRVSGTKRLRNCHDVYGPDDDAATWMLLRGFHSISSSGNCSGPYHSFKRQTPDACETVSDEMHVCA